MRNAANTPPMISSISMSVAASPRVYAASPSPGPESESGRESGPVSGPPNGGGVHGHCGQRVGQHLAHSPSSGSAPSETRPSFLAR